MKDDVTLVIGGVKGGRRLSTFGDQGVFEQTVEQELGHWVRQSEDNACQMWSALANVEWFHKEKDIRLAYSFRAAGDLVAALRYKGDYLNWYCCGRPAVVVEDIGDALGAQGWDARLAK